MISDVNLVKQTSRGWSIPLPDTNLRLSNQVLTDTFNQISTELDTFCEVVVVPSDSPLSLMFTTEVLRVYPLFWNKRRLKVGLHYSISGSTISFNPEGFGVSTVDKIGIKKGDSFLLLTQDMSDTVWESKSEPFTANINSRYFVDTTNGSVQVNLPLSPESGDTVVLCDMLGSFNTNALIVSSGTQVLNGNVKLNSLALEIEGQYATFLYINSVRGWKVLLA
jgi:hypothetical protein